MKSQMKNTVKLTVSQGKDIATLQYEMQDEGEDDEIEFLDEDEYEIEDYDEEEWD